MVVFAGLTAIDVSVGIGGAGEEYPDPPQPVRNKMVIGAALASRSRKDPQRSSRNIQRPSIRKPQLACCCLLSCSGTRICDCGGCRRRPPIGRQGPQNYRQLIEQTSWLGSLTRASLTTVTSLSHACRSPGSAGRVPENHRWVYLREAPRLPRAQ